MPVARNLFEWLAKISYLRLVFVEQLEAFLRIAHDGLELLIDFVDHRNNCFAGGGSETRLSQFGLRSRENLSCSMMLDC